VAVLVELGRIRQLEVLKVASWQLQQ